MVPVRRNSLVEKDYRAFCGVQREYVEYIGGITELGTVSYIRAMCDVEFTFCVSV